MTQASRYGWPAFEVVTTLKGGATHTSYWRRATPAAAISKAMANLPSAAHRRNVVSVQVIEGQQLT